MKLLRVSLLATFAALLITCPLSAAQQLTTEALRKRIDEEKLKIAAEVQQARNRIKAKNFLAARSSISDADNHLKKMRHLMPWHRLTALIDDAESRVSTRFWTRAKSTIDKAFRELDYQAQYIEVTDIWQHLEAAKQAVREKNEDVARRELTAARRLAPVPKVAGSLQRTHGYFDDAKDELLKLPIFFKSKRKDALKSLDKAEAELRKVYPDIEDVLKGKYSEKAREAEA
ncbi:MAG: hypothetical protein ACE5R4_16915 [Armatimonadota bacterium]